MLQHGSHRHGGCIAQSTNSAPYDIPCNRVEQIHIRRTAFAIFNAINHAP